MSTITKLVLLVLWTGAGFLFGDAVAMSIWPEDQSKWSFPRFILGLVSAAIMLGLGRLVIRLYKEKETQRLSNLYWVVHWALRTVLYPLLSLVLLFAGLELSSYIVTTMAADEPGKWYGSPFLQYRWQPGGVHSPGTWWFLILLAIGTLAGGAWGLVCGVRAWRDLWRRRSRK